MSAQLSLWPRPFPRGSAPGPAQDGAVRAPLPRARLAAPPRARARAERPPGAPEGPPLLLFQQGGARGAGGRGDGGGQAGDGRLRAVPAAPLPPRVRPAPNLHQRNPSARPGGERNPQNPAENVAAAPERPAAAVPGHGAAAAVPPGPAEGAAGAGSGHPALRQLPRHRPHVLLPPAAPHPALLDAAAAPAVPGARGLGAPRRLRGRARQPGAGGAGAARPAAAGTAAGALPAGAGGGAAARVPAPHPARRLLGAAAGAGDAAGAARPGAEPGAVPDAVAAAAAAAAPPAQPRPGAAGAGPGAAAARPGAAGRRRAARGLLPAWAQPRAPGAARVPRVAGALAAPVGAARSLGSVSAGAQHGAAGAQPRPRLTPPFCPETPPVWGRGTAGERPTGLPGFLPDYSSRFRLFGRPGDPEMRHLPPGGHAASRPRPVGSA